MIDSVDEHITLFFESENSPLTAAFSEAESTLEHAPVSGTFACFSALDLLAQCHAGSLEKKHLAKRMKKMWKTYGGLCESDAEDLFLLRNAVIHTFGQYAFSLKTKAETRYYWSTNHTGIFKRENRLVVHVNPNFILKYSKRVTASYREELASSKQRRKDFELVYKKIGQKLQSV